MRSAHWLTLLALPVCLPAGAEVVIETDFGAADQPVAITSPDGRTNVTGKLPKGWQENSTGSWQPDMVIRYTPGADGERRFLSIQRVSGGRIQLAHPLPELTEPAWFRLSLTARSPNGAVAELGVRFNGPPYSFPWSVVPHLDPVWRELTYDFRLDKQPQSCRVQFSLSDTGVVDIARLTLVRRSREELIAEIKEHYPTAGEGNLARTTRFPGGLPAGWFLDRETDDARIRVTTDPAVIGPGGSAALHVTGDGPWTINSSPFPVPWSFERHTASISLRGRCAGRVMVIGAGGQRWLGHTTFKVDGPDWQRVAVTFEPVLGGEVHGLRIQGEGELWLDAFQVERGTQATAYRAPAPCELALRCPASETSSAGVQFDGEPTRVEAFVTAAQPGAVLKARVHDLYGGARDLSPQPFAAARGALDYGPLGERRFGPFRIEAWLESADGGTLSGPAEVVVHRLRRPRHWGQDAPESPFGVHTLPATRHLVMAKAVGMNWVRLHDAGMQYVGWSWVEPEQGRWTWFDEAIARYRRQHLSILGQWETAPNWATGYPKLCAGYWDRWYQPRDLADWSQYVTAVTSRYRQDIRAWEVWNEPWGDFWAVYAADKPRERQRSATAAADYAALQAACWKAAKAVDPAITVVGFNSYAGGPGKDWTAKVAEAGGLATCDVFSYHRYSSEALGWPADAMGEHGLREAATPIAGPDGKLPKPAWMSEGTTLRYAGVEGFYEHTLPYPNRDEPRQTADALARYMVRVLSDGAEKLFLYTMHGLNYYHGSAAPNWRCLLANDGTLHPSAHGCSTLTWLLEGTRYAGVAELAAGVHGFTFKGAGRQVTVICPRPGHADWKLPAGGARLDLFGNPLLAGAPLGNEVVYLVN